MITSPLLSNVDMVLPHNHFALNSGTRWRHLEVRLHQHPPFFFDTPELSRHLVTLKLGSPVQMLQRRDGQCVEAIHEAGDIRINPAFRPEFLSWRQPCEVLSLQIDPHFLHQLGAE